jgi:hypothetical protein
MGLGREEREDCDGEGDYGNKEKQIVVRMNIMAREGMEWKNMTMMMVQGKQKEKERKRISDCRFDVNER